MSQMSPEELAAANEAQNGDEGRTPQDWHRYREQEKKTKAEKDRADKLQRELAFRDAGINPADKDAPPHTQMFVDSYKGDLTPEAITKAAVEMRVLAPEPAPTDPATTQPLQDAAKAAERTDAAAKGAQPDAAGTSVERVDQAFEEGGLSAMEAELRAQGIPTVHSP